MKLLITGVHATPAMALIDAINNSSYKDKLTIIYVGRKYALEGEKTISLEYKEITKKRIPFFSLDAGRLTRLISLRTIKNLLKIPLGFLQSFFILNKEKPDIIFSFGGYIAFPIALIGFFLRIPVYTHEQTISPGLANRLIGFFAKKVFCSFDESLKYFPSNKTVLTGNPVRKEIFNIEKKPFEITKDRPAIYVTGGSLGSHAINTHLQRILTKLTSKYIIIHQAGETEKYQDFEKLNRLRQQLPLNQRKNYFLVKHFTNGELGYVYHLADLVISRAGANTFFELLALEKPTIFIPLPWSANKEQFKQAEIFQKFAVGEIFSQGGSDEELLRLIDKMINNLKDYKKNFINLKFLYRDNVTTTILKEIFSR